MSELMKAVVYDRYGPPDVLRVEQMPRPVPKEQEILVRIRAAEVTKGDTELRSFRFPVKWFAWGLRLAWGVRRPRKRVLGGYFAGEVAACGGAVRRFAVGDRVFGCAKLRMGAYGQYACYPESYSISRLPDSIGYAEAAGALLGGLNAWHFLNLGKLKKGERILINGAGGSIGLMAIPMAKARGAEVTAVDKSEKEAVIRKAGADFFIDFQKERFSENGKRYDMVFNMVPGIGLKDCVGSLDTRGRYVMGNPRFADMMRSLYFGRKTGQSAHFVFAGETQSELDALRDMLENGQLKVPVDRVLPMEAAAEAHRLVEAEKRLGAIVLSFE